MKKIIILVAIFAFFSSGCAFKLSEKFKLCKRNDPQLDDCLVDAIDKGIKLISSIGLPKIGLPPIDPLKVETIVIGAGTSAVNLVQNYFNVSIKGFANSKVEKAHIDFNKKVLTFLQNLPTLIQEANYKINGKILILPVYGEGLSIIKFTSPVINHNIYFEEETKGNKKYYKITKYEAFLEISDAHFDFRNLFNGDHKLGDPVLKVVNDNWRQMFDDVKIGVEAAYSKVLEAIATILFTNVPIDDLFPN